MNTSTNQIDRYRKPYFTIFTYLFVLFVLTWSPFEFSIRFFNRLMEYNLEKLFFYLFHFRFLDVLGNIIMFLPLGIIFRRIFPVITEKSKVRQFWTVCILATLLSVTIEGGQLFLRRSTSALDVFFNGTGTVIGFFGTTSCGWLTRILHYVKNMWKNKRVKLIFLSLYGLFIGFVILNPLRFNQLNTWKGRYPLLLGNEGKGERPWEGELSRVAIYDRALKPLEIRSDYNNDMGNITISDPIVYYDFKDTTSSIAHDLSKFDKPINLAGEGVIRSQGKVRFSNNHFLQSVESGRKIVDFVKRSNQFSVILWMRPDNLVQTGPARIVSLSKDADSRNFTLGQQGRSLHFRVRTSLAGTNGSLIHLRTEKVFHDTSWHHVAATFKHGVERIFVNGKPTHSSVRADLDWAPAALLMGRNAPAKIGFCLILFMPWGFIIYDIFPRRSRLLALLVTGVLLACQQFFYHYFLGQVFNGLMFTTALISTGWGTMINSFWKTARPQQLEDV